MIINGEEAEDFLILMEGSVFVSSLAANIIAFTRSGEAFGTGGEIQWYPGDIIGIGLQYLLSSGNDAWMIADVDDIPGLLVVDKAESSGTDYTHRLGCYVSLHLFNVLDISAGYTFNQLGISAEDLVTVGGSYYAQSTDVISLLEEEYHGVLASPDAFLRHRISTTLSVPRITEKIGAHLTASFAPLDPSCLLVAGSSLQLGNRNTAFLSASAALGSASSVYGQMPEKYRLSISMETVF